MMSPTLSTLYTSRARELVRPLDFHSNMPTYEKCLPLKCGTMVHVVFPNKVYWHEAWTQPVFLSRYML